MGRKTQGDLNINPLLAGILVAVSLGGLAFLLAIGWGILFPQSVNQAQMDADCDLRNGPCVAAFGDGNQITLAISPAVPIANEPLRLTVEVNGHQPDNVQVMLSGKRMNMGMITAPLLDIGHGLFTGDTSLPMCVRRQMTWLATVILNGPRGHYQAAFEFIMRKG